MRTTLPLLAAITVALASPSIFSVHDDLLAYPQYDVVFDGNYVTEADADAVLRLKSSVWKDPKTGKAGQGETVSSPQARASELSGREANTRTSHDAESSSSDESSSLPGTRGSSSYEQIWADGVRFLCAIPTVKTPARNETLEAAARLEEEKELARATERGWELLKPLDRDCLYYISGWWSYAFCYNSHVKQFHQLPAGKGVPFYPPAEDPNTPSYILGRFKPGRESGLGKGRANLGIDAGAGGLEAAELQARGDTRYLMQRLGGGTTCDLTGKERKIEVQFHCNPSITDKIGWIKEIATCTYLMVIYTPRLCNDMAFRPPRENKVNAITCREIIPNDAVHEWELYSHPSAWAASASSEQDPSSVGGEDGTAKTRPVVGGVEIGAKTLVGGEGRKIETSSAVRGGRGGGSGGNERPPNQAPGSESTRRPLSSEGEDEEIVASGSSTSSQQLPDADLRNLDIDPAVLEALKKKLQNLAAGDDWRLFVVDDDEGARVLRGDILRDGQGGGGSSDGEDGGDDDEDDGDGRERERWIVVDEGDIDLGGAFGDGEL
ncbi:MAG: hypothetical protein M1819_004632 [Sarea resinae]|nr:MAG: hypothetical protein M1819_004632 [Sarea resinae]